MGARLGRALYWLCCIIAALLIALAVIGFYNEGGELFFKILVAIMAVVVWLLGRGLKYILAGE